MKLCVGSTRSKSIQSFCVNIFVMSPQDIHSIIIHELPSSLNLKIFYKCIFTLYFFLYIQIFVVYFGVINSHIFLLNYFVCKTTNRDKYMYID